MFKDTNIEVEYENVVLLSCDIDTNPSPNQNESHLGSSQVLLDLKGIRTAHLNTCNYDLIYHMDDI